MLQQQRLYEISQLTYGTLAQEFFEEPPSSTEDSPSFFETKSKKNQNGPISGYVTSDNSFVLLLDEGSRLVTGSLDEFGHTSFHSVPWFHDLKASAIAFSPEKDFLAIVCSDGSIYVVKSTKIIPGLVPDGVNINHRELPHCGFAYNQPPHTVAALPKCILWWVTQDFASIAFIGTDEGEVIGFDLTDGREVGCMQLSECEIKSLETISDRSMDSLYLIITDSHTQQWRILLEKKTSGYTWPAETTEAPPPVISSMVHSSSDIDGSDELISPRLRIAAGIKQMSVASLATLRHRLSEGKKMLERVGGGGGGGVNVKECTRFPVAESISSRVGGYTGMSVQSSGTFQVFAGLHRGEFLLSTYNCDCELIPSSTFRLPRNAKQVILLEKVIVTIVSRPHYEETEDSIHLVSRFHSNFNTDCLGDAIIQSFRLLSGEKVLGLSRLNSNTEDIILVTSRGVYRLYLSLDPVQSFLELAMRGENCYAVILADTFSLEYKKLLELAGDLRLKEKDCSGALSLYRSSGLRVFKIVLKFAASGTVQELLSYLASVLKAPSLDVNTTNRSHMSNLALMSYFQQVLTKNTPTLRLSFQSSIREFIDRNKHFDEYLAIKLASDTKEWDLLYYISRNRGIRYEMVQVIIRNIRSLVGDFEDEAVLPSDKLQSVSTVLSNMPSGERNCLLSALLDQFNLESVAFDFTTAVNLIQILIGALPLLEEEGLQAVAIMTSPDNPALGPFLSKDSELIRLFLNLFITSILLLIKKRSGPNLEYRANLTKLNTYVSESSSKRTVKITVLSAGGSHGLLSKSGGSSVYSWGSTALGVLGLGSMSKFVEPMKEISYFRENSIQALALSAGKTHCLALTNYGVYSWGSSNYGQCGHGFKFEQKRPMFIKELSSVAVISVSAGAYHSLALDCDGKVWSWGQGVYGQLGSGDIEDRLVPQRIFGLYPKTVIIEISAGYAHSLLLTSDRRVLAFGNNLFGQLGNGTKVKSGFPIPVDTSSFFGDSVDQIVSGFFHNLVLTKSGRVFVWGCNPEIIHQENQAKKKLANAEGRKDETAGTAHLKPRLVPTEGYVQGFIVNLSAGNYHSALLTDRGTLYCFGRNTHGQLGDNSRKESKIPVLAHGLADTLITHISCGPDYTLALSSSGVVFAWGSNAGGQLGDTPLEEPSESSDKIVVMKSNRRIIRFNHKFQNSCDIPRPLSGTKEIYEETQGKFFLSKRVSVDFLSSPFIFPRKFNLRIKEDAFSYLHAALQVFHKILETRTLLKKCVISDNSQGAAKIRLLDHEPLQAFEFTLQSIIKSRISNAPLEVFRAFSYYLSFSLNSVGESLFQRLVATWSDQKWSFVVLENMILKEADPDMLQTLVLALFGPEQKENSHKGPVELVGPNLVDHFSPDFCLKIGDSFVKKMKNEESS